MHYEWKKQNMPVISYLSHQIFLGQYPEEHFTEEVPCQKIKDFQVELKRLSAEIKARNSVLDLPYTYLDPEVTENSVSIWILEGSFSSFSSVTKTEKKVKFELCPKLILLI